MNGPWICNKGRDLARIFERPRAEQAHGERPARRALPAAIDAARRLIGEAATRGGAGLELGLQRGAERVQAKRWATASTHSSSRTASPQPGERLEDDLLIRRDKNPNTAAARALFPRLDNAIAPISDSTDLVLVWGEGFDFARVPAGSPSHRARRLRRTRERARRCVHSHQHPDRARRTLHELRGRGERVRGVLSEKGIGRRRRGTLRCPGNRRERAAHDPGPRHLRCCSSATRWRCCWCSARC